MARRRVTSGGTLVLDSEGMAKLAAGDPRARAYEPGRDKEQRVVVVHIWRLARLCCAELLGQDIGGV